MYDPFPSVFSKTGHFTWKPVKKTNNQFLDRVVENLEKIYKNIDWPYVNPSLEVSLYQSGKSRADLWQFAALVALEEALERANRACDLDYHQRQCLRRDTVHSCASGRDSVHFGPRRRRLYRGVPGSSWRIVSRDISRD